MQASSMAGRYIHTPCMEQGDLNEAWWLAADDTWCSQLLGMGLVFRRRAAEGAPPPTHGC